VWWGSKARQQSLGGAMATDDIAKKRGHLEQLITAKSDQLKILEIQKAHYGIDCPLHIAAEAQQLRLDILELEAHLKSFTSVATASRQLNHIATPLRPAVMVVEHNFDLLWIFRRAINQTIGEACDVVALATGADACAQVLMRAVPLAIVAEHLIDMQGIEVVERIKQRSPRTRIALTSNNPTLAAEALAWRSGVNYYLKKPFALDDIMTIVRETLT
jgi:CheY-like chemotaxis protein